MQNLYAYDLFVIELSIGDTRRMTEEPVVSRVIADTGSVEDLYATKGKRVSGCVVSELRFRLAVSSRKQDTKPVHHDRNGIGHVHLHIVTCSPGTCRPPR